MRILRKVVFYLFLLAYLASCPVIILDALGYLVAPGARAGLVKTGLISVSTDPPGASVYLGKMRYARQTPTTIPDLLPGEYAVRVSLRGYLPWSRTVQVEAGQATVLDRVLLLPRTLRPRLLLAEEFQDLAPIAGTPYALLLKGRALEDVVVYDAEDGAYWPLLPASSPMRSGRWLSMETVERSPFVLMQVATPEGRKVLRVKLKRGAGAEDLTRLFSSKPQWVTWDPQAPQRLFALRDEVVDRLDVEPMAVYPKLVEGVRGLGLDGGAVYVLEKQGGLLRLDHNGEHPEPVLAEDPQAVRVFAQARGPGRLTALGHGLLLFLGERGELLINRPPYRVVSNGVEGHAWDARRRQLLVWRRDRLGVMHLAGSQEDAGGEAPGAVTSWLVEGARAIQQAWWAYEGSHVIFRDHQAVNLLELPIHGSPLIRRLLQVRPGSSVLYAEDTGTLYYLDREQGRLSALDLLFKRKAPPLPLPMADRQGQRRLP